MCDDIWAIQSDYRIYIIRPVWRGGSLGSYEPPSSTCGKQKSEPNHFVAVQDLLEGSELEASLKRLEVPSYTLYAPHCPPFWLLTTALNSWITLFLAT